jgi:hypothetical protein
MIQARLSQVMANAQPKVVNPGIAPTFSNR